jgi:hypothetical protein
LAERYDDPLRPFLKEGNGAALWCENSIVDHTSDIMATVRDLCVEAALRLALGQKARWTFLIDQATGDRTFAALSCLVS